MMSAVDRLLTEYIAEYRAGGDVETARYLAQVTGRDRLELESLIGRFLERAPRDQVDPARFEGTRAAGVVESLEAAMGPGGVWPSLLPQLRERAQLKRREVVKRLAAALGVTDREQKVARYYHQMEQGRLPARGISDQVLQALGTILGESATALRRAGETLTSPPAGAAPGSVFARTAEPDAAYGLLAPATAAAAGSQSAEPEAEWDQVDQLFRGAGQP